MRHKYVDTTWEVRTYDVWGNRKEGYEVNDCSIAERDRPMRLRVQVNNVGTPHEFESTYPSDTQIRQALDIKPRVNLSLDGDDLTIYVTHESTSYPLGELHCTSHASLSPVRKA